MLKKFKRFTSLMVASLVGFSSFTLSEVETKASTVVVIDPTVTYQTMDGFGTSLSWWANIVGGWDMPGKEQGKKARDEVMDLIFGESGLGLNIMRYNVGGGDDPSHNHIKRVEAVVPGYKTSADGAYNWDADANQVWVLQEGLKKRQTQGDSITEFFSNTPPYYMTVSGCASGNTNPSLDNLKADQYENFATYLIDVCNYFKDTLGITFDYVEPINEPDSSYWQANSSKQEGAHFSAGTSQSNIYNAVKTIINSQALPYKLAGTDETNIDHTIHSFKLLDSNAKDALTKINTHAYGGSQRAQLRDLAASNSKKLWMSEVCVGDEAHDHNAMGTALQLSEIITKDLREIKAEAWVVWQAVESELENLRLDKTSGNWGLIHGVYEETPIPGYHVYEQQSGKPPINMNNLGIKRGDYFLTKQYYAMGQYSKFIKKGYTIIDVGSDNALAAISPDKKEIVIVSTNASNAAEDTTFYLSAVSGINNVEVYRTSATESITKLADATVTSGQFLNVTLPANSITTYVVKGSSPLYNGGTSVIVNDGVVGTGNGKLEFTSSNSSDTWSYYESQIGAYSNDVHYSKTTGDSVTFRFNGTQAIIYGSKALDSGIVSVSLDGGTPVEIDLYAANRLEKQVIYDTGTLIDGSHTIIMTITGRKGTQSTDTFFAVDYAKIVSGILAGADRPILRSANPWDSMVYLNFTEVYNASEYTIKYGTQSGVYTNSVTDVRSLGKGVANLINGTTYYFVVTATVNGVETAASNEILATPSIVNPYGTLYSVNCGDGTPNVLDDETYFFGIYNSITDQAFDIDKISGKQWGYTTNNGTWAQYVKGDRFDTLRCDTTNAAGGWIEYAFEVPNGSYAVNLGFKDPWSNQNRKQDIIIEGQKVASDYVINGEDLKYYSTTVADGMLNVRIERSATGGDNAMISWIQIDPANSQIVLSANKAGEAYTITGTPPVLPDTVDVKFTDGTTGTSSVTWDTLDPAKYAEPFKTFTLKGSVNGTLLKTEATINTIPDNLLYYVDSAGISGGNTSASFDGIKAIVPNLLNNSADKLFEGSGWGYVETNIGTYNSTDAYNSLIYSNVDTLTYKFDGLTVGSYYTLAMGFYDPWSVTRPTDIWVNRVNADSVTVNSQRTLKLIENAFTDNGELEIKLTPSGTSGNKPIISFVYIYKQSDITPPAVAVVSPKEGSWSKNVPTTVVLRVEAVSEVSTLSLAPPDVSECFFKVSSAEAEAPFVSGDTSWSNLLDEPTYNPQTGEFMVDVNNVGDNYIHWYIKNTAGEQVNGKCGSFKIDNVPPQFIKFEVNATAAGIAYLTAEATDNAGGAGINEYKWFQMDAGAYKEMSKTSTGAYTVSGLTNGKQYTFKSEVSDLAGNQTMSNEETVTVPDGGDGGDNDKVSSVTLNKNELTLEIGKSFTLLADVKPVNATNKNVTWESGAQEVATVDINGVVTAVSEGTAVITVKTEDGGLTDSCIVTVKEIKVTIAPSLKKNQGIDITILLPDFKDYEYCVSILDKSTNKPAEPPAVKKKPSWKRVTKRVIPGITATSEMAIFLRDKTTKKIIDVEPIDVKDIKELKAPSAKVTTLQTGEENAVSITFKAFKQGYETVEYQLAKLQGSLIPDNWKEIAVPNGQDVKKPFTVDNIAAEIGDYVFLRTKEGVDYKPKSLPTKGVKALVSGKAPDVVVSVADGTKAGTYKITVKAKDGAQVNIKALQYAIVPKGTSPLTLQTRAVRWSKVSKDEKDNVKLPRGISADNFEVKVRFAKTKDSAPSVAN